VGLLVLEVVEYRAKSRLSGVCGFLIVTFVYEVRLYQIGVCLTDL